MVGGVESSVTTYCLVRRSKYQLIEFAPFITERERNLQLFPARFPRIVVYSFDGDAAAGERRRTQHPYLAASAQLL